jgi:amino acid transporter
MANRVWGAFSVVVILAILNSALANANAGVNAASRVLFAMGRVNTLPGPLAHISQRFRTPDFAIIFTMIVGIVLTLWPGNAYGATTAFALIGIIITILILLVYIATCIAVPFFYLREHREEFNIVRHVLFPVIPAIVLLFPIYAQFVPAPPAPLNLAGPLCAAWFVLGIVIVAFLSLRRPAALASSDKVFIEE